MPQMGFEPTIVLFVRAKTVHVSDLTASVISINGNYPQKTLTTLYNY
jgi:hypothetical protein